MSAGFVSAAAGLVLSENPTITAPELKERLCETGDMMAHLQDKVKDGRSLNVKNALSGLVQNSIIQIYPQDDFNEHGYAISPKDNWALFAPPPYVDINHIKDQTNLTINNVNGKYESLVLTRTIV
jgi:hypothetical protein